MRGKKTKEKKSYRATSDTVEVLSGVDALWTWSKINDAIYNEQIKLLPAHIWSNTYRIKNEYRLRLSLDKCRQEVTKFLGLPVPGHASQQSTTGRLVTCAKTTQTLHKEGHKTARNPSKPKDGSKFYTMVFTVGFCSFFEERDEGLCVILGDKKETSPNRAVVKLNDRLADEVRRANYEVAQVLIRRDEDASEFVLAVTYNINHKIASKRQPTQERWASIDPGLKSSATMVTRDGEVYQFVTDVSKSESIEARTAQLDKKMKSYKKGSRRWKKLKETRRRLFRTRTNHNVDQQRKIARRVADLCVKLDIGKLFYGDIEASKLTKGRKGKANTARVGRGTLGRLKGLTASACELDRVTFSLVNEAYTSKTNCLTGEINFDLTLNDREVEVDPGLIIDRDVNGAVNISVKGQRGSWLPSVDFLASCNAKTRRIFASELDVCTVHDWTFINSHSC